MEFEKSDIQTIAHLLMHFKGDIDKVTLWLNTINPLLGGCSPADMISHGRSAKLLDFVKTSIEENTP